METNPLSDIVFKGTLMQIWKSANFLSSYENNMLKFHIKTPFVFWDMRMWGMWKVCLQAFRKNTMCWKLAYF